MKNVNRLIAILIVFVLIVSSTACESKTITKNKNEITMYDYCPSLDDFLKALKSDGRKVLGYAEKKNVASWYTNEDLSEYTRVECTKDGLIFRIEIDNNYGDLLRFLKMLPGSVSSKEELEKEFSAVTETTNNIVSGEVIYTDRSQFSTSGIKYSKTVMRTPKKTITQTISAECEDIIINPYEYQDLCPNLTQEEFYNIAETKQNSNAYDEAIFYYTCARPYNDSETKIKECAYIIALESYESGNLIEAGKYSKIAIGYENADTILANITETLYDEAVAQLNDYADTGNVDMLEKSYEKFAVFNEAYKETKRFLNIAECCKNIYTSNGLLDDSLLNDELGRKIVQNHMLIKFFSKYPSWCIVGDVFGDGQYYITGSFKYETSYNGAFIYISICRNGYDDNEIYTESKRLDDYTIPESISDYSIYNGVFTYENSPKFKIEIISREKICLHSFLTGKNYYMKQEDSEEIHKLLKNKNEWQ